MLILPIQELNALPNVFQNPQDDLQSAYFYSGIDGDLSLLSTMTFLITHEAPLAAIRPFSLSKDRCMKDGFRADLIEAA